MLKTNLNIATPYFASAPDLPVNIWVGSSFITEVHGEAEQHSLCRSMFCAILQGFTRSRNAYKTSIGMQYLPFGELFTSQRNHNFDSRCKFSAKTCPAKHLD